MDAVHGAQDRPGRTAPAFSSTASKSSAWRRGSLEGRRIEPGFRQGRRRPDPSACAVRSFERASYIKTVTFSESCQWFGAWSLVRRDTSAVPLRCETVIAEPCERMGIRRKVSILATTCAMSPLMIGCLRPVILVLVFAFTEPHTRPTPRGPVPRAGSHPLTIS